MKSSKCISTFYCFPFVLFVVIFQLERPVPIKFDYIENNFMCCMEESHRGLEICDDESVMAGLSLLGELFI